MTDELNTRPAGGPELLLAKSGRLDEAARAFFFFRSTVTVEDFGPGVGVEAADAEVVTDFFFSWIFLSIEEGNSEDLTGGVDFGEDTGGGSSGVGRVMREGIGIRSADNSRSTLIMNGSIE